MRDGLKIHRKENKGHITTYGRRHLGAKDFALEPGDAEKSAGIAGRYPIDTTSRARNALARVHQHGTPEQIAEVEKKVGERHPDILVSRRRTD